MKTVVGLLLTLYICAPAQAASRTEIAQSIALKRSGPVCVPDGGKVAISRSDMVRGLAHASYDHPLAAPDDRNGYFNCRIQFRRGHIPWREFCHAMVHEYMHLAAWRAKAGDEYVATNQAGQRFVDNKHSRTPTSLMFVRPEKIYFRCRKSPASYKTDASAASESKPIVILLPGGGWQTSYPATMQPWVDDFRSHGIQARAISYPTGNVVRAIDYVRSVVAAERGPVVLYGISAGGTIAAAIAAEGSVAGAVNLVGPTDFTRWTGMGLVYMREIGMTTYAQKRAASPYWRLTQPSPQLQQCGLADPLVTYEQCLRYDDAARKLQPDTRLDALVNGHSQSAAERAVAREWVAARLR